MPITHGAARGAHPQRRFAVLALGVLVVLLLAPASRADAPAQQGWWNKLRQGGVPAPAPPDAPADGLYVAADPTGPLALAAVRFRADVPGSLTLHMAPNQTAPGTAVSISPATKDWKAVQNGDWTAAPTFNAAVSIAGRPSTDGSSITWPLPESFPTTGGVIDVVLVEQGSGPATTAFGKPGADAYTSQAVPAPESEPALTPSPTPEPLPDAFSSPGAPVTTPLGLGTTPAVAPAAPPGASGTYAATGKTFVGTAPPKRKSGLGHLQLPFPVLLLGTITGMTYGILAVGLVLIYRSNRIINFAHGEIGAFAAAILGLTVTRWHVPYWVAFPLALAIAAAVGGLSEVVVIRRLRNAPPVMSIVATLGLAQFLLLFSLVVNTQASAGRLFPRPAFLPEFDVGALRITQAYSAMLFITPVLVISLVWFLRKSRSGLGIRASAANPDAARLAGVFAGRMSTLAWAIAGAVSAFTAILVLPTRGFANAQFLGPGLLLRALAAAVVARMVSLPVALAAGLGVGIVEQVLLWNYPRGGLVEAVLFVLVMGVLLIQRRRATARDEEKGSWAAVQPWPPLPERLREVWAIRNLGLIAGGAALAVALLMPILATNATAVTLVVIMAFSIVGLSVGIVTGLGGQLSLGQFAFAGVGATVSYVVTFQTGNYLLGFIAAGFGAAAVSLLIGLPALRIRGLMLAVATLGFALATQGWLFQQTWMLGEGIDPGRPVIGHTLFDTGKKYYLFALIPLVASVWLAGNVWRSGVGRRLRAIRDNEAAARAFTIPATAVKLQGFVLAGFLAGMGGALYGHALSRLSATAFPIGASIDVAAMTVLGGIGLLAGPLIGAFYIIGIPQFLPLDNAGLAATALGWLVLILYWPGGIAQMLKPARDRLIDLVARASGVDAGAARREETDSSADAAAPAGRLTIVRRIDRYVEGTGPLLAVNGVEKSFGGVRAVDGVTFEVAPGEIVGLIGPNGAGKTTLFELIGGFTKPDAGQVVFAGKDVSRLGPEGRGSLGLIRSFQDAALFPTLTVLETVMLALERAEPTRMAPALAGWGKADRRKEERARELIASMGLHAFRNKQIAALSTGTRRITELACLVALEPTLLLLDEPASGIAQRETEALGDLLSVLKDALDLTLIVIEHDIPMVMRLADRVIAMESGRLIADGTPEEIKNNPLVIESYLGGDVSAIERSGVRDADGAKRAALAAAASE
jgi:ABC-type branched-subunit amino acid transport system ATPase component/ABC-type branched-subunit amino acid transport system permease subunit